jgi:hypothetical protein
MRGQGFRGAPRGRGYNQGGFNSNFSGARGGSSNFQPVSFR